MVGKPNSLEPQRLRRDEGGWRGEEPIRRVLGGLRRVPEGAVRAFEVAGNPVSWAVRFSLRAPGAALQASAARGNNRVAVELLLTNKTTSKALFDQIRQDQSAIEPEVGEPLEWLRQDDYIVSRIALATKAFNVSDREQWPQQHGWLLDYLLKFKAAFWDRVSALTVPGTAPEPEAAG